ncbi:MAG: DNA replication/repair protein RecF [Candidatus Melainabacteria bacterium]|nr:DNA replication/repair protein RecF [Candidatus Melainabacteria bacterium]
MLLKNLKLHNFRNYNEQDIEFKPGLNIILGENAQGKSNLLEAIEYISTGKSYRATHDTELISRSKNQASIAVQYLIDWDKRSNLQNISIDFKTTPVEGKTKSLKLEKKVKINGATYSTTRNLKGSLCVVSFKSEDLNLARGGPKYRRDWIDNLLSSIDLGYRETSNRYAKCITQRNRLLKNIAEKGGRYNLSDSDKEQLRVWSRQAASLGAKVTKERLKLLDQMRPLIESYQEKISGKNEPITVRYFQTSTEEDPESPENLDQQDDQLGPNWNETSESELESRLMSLYKSRFNEELARKQTLSGPHRDDIVFCLNDLPAKNYGSQGQTRTLVLSLKIAELDLVSDHLHEPPILLLDDVLAELDLNRQNFLMQEVANRQDMQTVITTTHIDAFQKNWLNGASFYEVAVGIIKEKISC